MTKIFKTSFLSKVLVHVDLSSVFFILRLEYYSLKMTPKNDKYFLLFFSDVYSSSTQLHTKV